MGWYWDQDTDEEVCFNGDGSKYMRYNPNTGQFDYSSLASVLLQGKRPNTGAYPTDTVVPRITYGGVFSFASLIMRIRNPDPEWDVGITSLRLQGGLVSYLAYKGAL